MGKLMRTPAKAISAVCSDCSWRKSGPKAEISAREHAYSNYHITTTEYKFTIQHIGTPKREE